MLFSAMAKEEEGEEGDEGGERDSRGAEAMIWTAVEWYDS